MITATGRIGDYHWAEFKDEKPQLSLPTVVRELSRYLIGLRGVNVSWDSGLLLSSDPWVYTNWRFQDGHAITPVIGEDLITHWPDHGDGFDEWYFFREIPQELALAAYCNWTDNSIENWQDYAFKSDLRSQLERTKPVLVIGEGYRIFVISNQESCVRDFLHLASEN